MDAGSTSSDDTEGYRRRLLRLNFDASSDSEKDLERSNLTVDEECISSTDTEGYRRRLFSLNIAQPPSSTLAEDSTDLSDLDSSFVLNDEPPHQTVVDADKHFSDPGKDGDSNQMSILQQQEMSSTFLAVYCIVFSLV